MDTNTNNNTPATITSAVYEQVMDMISDDESYRWSECDPDGSILTDETRTPDDLADATPQYVLREARRLQHWVLERLREQDAKVIAQQVMALHEVMTPISEEAGKISQVCITLSGHVATGFAYEENAHDLPFGFGLDPLLSNSHEQDGLLARITTWATDIHYRDYTAWDSPDGMEAKHHPVVVDTQRAIKDLFLAMAKRGCPRPE